ncbi:heterokaryon incompatibility protein-domain-containing protein [Paraphoma chrysanthemicola]|nr:heterokaryon incompatibility protein-domain-containing protein [Paraphoma chrysanthemicola]
MEPYTYRPFHDPGKQIRLVTVRRDWTGTIRCKFTTFDIAASPSYRALSYTWGAPTPTRRIAVEQGYLDIRENLCLFLDQYCKERASLIWIDQLSIDQSNTSERNLQVGMMGQIFTQAECVIVWLGADKMLVEAAQTISNPPETPEKGFQQYEAVRTILNNVYFTRLWVVQEVVLAKDVWIMAGPKAWISWANLRDALSDALSTSSQWRGEWDRYGYTYAERCLPDRARSLLWRERDSHRDLVECLGTFADHDCEDPRDKVYGLLALVNQINGMPIDYSKSAHRIPIDYSISSQDVFINVMKHILPTKEAKATLVLLCQEMRFSQTETFACRSLLEAYFHLFDLRIWDKVADLPIDVGFEAVGNDGVSFDLLDQSDGDGHRLRRWRDCWWLMYNGKTTYFEC